MKPHHWYAAAIFVVALLVTTVASAQEHRQFDEHDRQVTRDWYNQHQTNPLEVCEIKIVCPPERKLS
jgi:hypothetical protein